MKLTGNITAIKQKRDNSNQDIALAINKIAYVTHKKDGKYYQPFEFEDELPAPLVITGDCLARIPNTYLEEGEYEFQVFDKTGDAYVLNENKALAITTAYDFDEQLTILSSVSYVVTISNEEFKQLKTDRAKAGKSKKGKR
ncbi:hypothetical protein [Pontibacter liquoris]|uniref:hypothetical protein n=1 Tax=Pontibacter liquoris TaxID=2905677 RepID=UPI001FA75D62|nr:hypothetical protein [Pontibacter liquoris]